MRRTRTHTRTHKNTHLGYAHPAAGTSGWSRSSCGWVACTPSSPSRCTRATPRMGAQRARRRAQTAARPRPHPSGRQRACRRPLPTDRGPARSSQVGQPSVAAWRQKVGELACKHSRQARRFCPRFPDWPPGVGHRLRAGSRTHPQFSWARGATGCSVPWQSAAFNVCLSDVQVSGHCVHWSPVWPCADLGSDCVPSLACRLG